MPQSTFMPRHSTPRSQSDICTPTLRPSATSWPSNFGTPYTREHRHIRKVLFARSQPWLIVACSSSGWGRRGATADAQPGRIGTVGGFPFKYMGRAFSHELKGSRLSERGGRADLRNPCQVQFFALRSLRTVAHGRLGVGVRGEVDRPSCFEATSGGCKRTPCVIL